MTLPIRGLYPPLVTPFDRLGPIDFDRHARNLERWNAAPLAGVVVLGSNSETVMLTEEEKLALVEATAARMPPDRLLIAGTGLESSRATIELTNRAAERGARAALVLTPFYYRGRMTDDALLRHFETVAGAVDVPVLLYNVPKFTGLNVSERVVTTLSRHPNIVGMKDSSGQVPQLARFRAVADPSFEIIAGTASVWYPALTLGLRAGVLALANCAPAACAEVQTLYEAGAVDEARARYLRLLPVNTAVTATYGIAGLKYACDLLGYDAGHVRAPLLPLDESARRQIRSILEEAGLLP